MVDNNNIGVRNGIRQHKSDRHTVNNFDKFCLLMWKNFLLQYRHTFQAIIQIVIPILITANLLFIRSLIAPQIRTTNTTYNAFSVNAIPLRLETNYSEFN